MGINTISLRLLAMLSRLDEIDLTSVATLGRFEMNMDRADLQKQAKRYSWALPALDRGDYCEPLLHALGAGTITSFDASAYEGASDVADFNEPLPDKYAGGFTTYLDFGSVEHVFDTRQVVLNINHLLAERGRAVILTNCNGKPGHGLYQFSPEFFYSVFQERNGFAGTKVFLIDAARGTWRYAMDPASLGRRNAIPNRHYAIACVTEKIGHCDRICAQQSDYENIAWRGTHVAPKRSAPSVLRTVIKRCTAWGRAARRDWRRFRSQTIAFNPDAMQALSEISRTR